MLSVQLTLLALDLAEKYARKTPPPYCPAPPPSAPCAPAPASRFDLWPPELPIPPMPKPEPDPPKPLERWPISVRLGLAAGPELVASGWGSIGIAGQIGVRYHAVSLDFAAHGDPWNGTQSFAGGSVGFSLFSGALLLCGHHGWLEGCGIGASARLSFAPRFPRMPSSALYGAAGVRGAMNFPIVPPRVFLHVGIDVFAPIRPPGYVSPRGDVFQVAGLGAGLAAGLLLELPPRF